MVDEIQRKLQEEIDRFKQVEKDYHNTLSRRQQLDGQLNENTVVMEELHFLKTGNDIYKLIGPVLIKQNLVDAKENVDKRIQFITTELRRTEESIVAIEKKQETHRENLNKLQQAYQQAHPGR